MARRTLDSTLRKAVPVLLARSNLIGSATHQQLLLFPGRGSFLSQLPSLRRLSDTSRLVAPKSLRNHWSSSSLQKQWWWQWRGGGISSLCDAGWYGGLKSIAWRFRSQALESYCLWHGPLLKSLRGALWPAERWLLVTGVLRNSRSWVPSFAVGIMRPERWLCVAAVTSLNTVGAHIPRMSLLLLAQVLARAGNAESPSRDAYFPLETAFRQVDPLRETSSRMMTVAVQLWNEVCIWVRLCCLVFYFLPLLVTYPFTSVSEAWWKMWLRSLRGTLESCGPAFIKWGQWASTRRDLFPPEVACELRKLQKESPAHSGDVSRRVIEAAFSLPADVIFNQFDAVPMASGSIGQIHRARLSAVGGTVTGLKEGTEVAVKVRHPNVDVAFQRDMKLMLWIARCVDRSPLLRGFDLHEMICQFATPMAEQVDLCMEAANLQCFRHNFRKNSRVIFPEPLFPLVTPDILVETFHKGVSVEDIIDQRKSRETALAELGSAAFFDMVVKHNLLHADLHPGNILVEYAPPKTKISTLLQKLSNMTSEILPPDSWNPFAHLFKKWTTGRELSPNIVLLDAGMATQLTPKERFHMLGLFRSVAELDGEMAAEHTLSFAGPNQRCPDPTAFRQEMLDHFALIRQPDWSEDDFVSSVDAFGRVIDIIREHKVTLPGQIVSCLFTVFLLEGWASKLDPQHSIMDQVKRILKKLDWSFERQIKDGANKVLMDSISNLTLQVSPE